MLDSTGRDLAVGRGSAAQAAGVQMVKWDGAILPAPILDGDQPWFFGSTYNDLIEHCKAAPRTARTIHEWNHKFTNRRRKFVHSWKIRGRFAQETTG
ncbi:MAG: hypothetical protein FJZ96_07040 [Chloroflexi bacterium]|nr:hypothetical protein [Chloroflexota bacterium]